MASLAVPAARFRDTFLAGAGEFAGEGRLDSTYCVGLGYSLDTLKPRYLEFVRDLVALGDPARLRPGRYLDQVRWLAEADEYLGQISLRPELASEYLLAYGGHIGYSIRPSRRRQGFGTQALTLALEAAALLGLRRVLVTCDSDNLGSRLIIERNGGVFERALTMPARAFQAEGRPPRPGVTKLRYWFEPTAGSRT